MNEWTHHDGIYYLCPFVGCNWWARVPTVLDGRAALVEHVKARHALQENEEVVQPTDRN